MLTLGDILLLVNKIKFNSIFVSCHGEEINWKNLEQGRLSKIEGTAVPNFFIVSMSNKSRTGQGNQCCYWTMDVLLGWMTNKSIKRLMEISDVSKFKVIFTAKNRRRSLEWKFFNGLFLSFHKNCAVIPKFCRKKWILNWISLHIRQIWHWCQL